MRNNNNNRILSLFFLVIIYGLIRETHGALYDNTVNNFYDGTANDYLPIVLWHGMGE